MQHLSDDFDLAEYACRQGDDDIDLGRFDIGRERQFDISRQPGWCLADGYHVLHERRGNLAVWTYGNGDRQIRVTPYEYLQRIARPNEVIGGDGCRSGDRRRRDSWRGRTAYRRIGKRQSSYGGGTRQH